MAADRSRYGLIGSAFGAVLLAVSVFLPWYGVISHARPSGALAPQLTALSAHQALENMSIVLLVLAALALLDTLFGLARAGALPDGAGGSLALLGTISTAWVAYRILDPPALARNLGSPSLREGAWLALAGSLLMLAGGLWPRVAGPAARGEGAFAGLSKWTPQS